MLVGTVSYGATDLQGSFAFAHIAYVNGHDGAVFWVESALQLNPILTLGLGPLFVKYLRPLAGKFAPL